jgi:hypothetical protein
MNGKADAATMRANWPRLFAFAQGGEWVEGSAYNLGTLQLILMSALAMPPGRYPEIETLARDLIDHLPWTVTPGDQLQVEWGDVQEPRLWSLHRRVAILTLATALVGDPTGKARSEIDRLTAAGLGNQWHFFCYRALWVFGAIAEPVPDLPVPDGFRTTAAGLTIHRGPNHLLQVHTPPWYGFDHSVYSGSDVRLWYDGKWVLDHPLGYMTRPPAQNTALLAGLGKMDAHEWSAVETPTGCIVTARTWGPAKPLASTRPNDPPPAFVEDHTRTITFEAPGRVTVSDHFKGVPPDRIDRYYTWEQNAINTRLALWEVVYHCFSEPVEVAPGVWEYTTPWGRLCRLTGPSGGVKLKTDSTNSGGGYWKPGELLGWQIRFLSDEPEVTIDTTMEVVGASPPPPPPPPPPLPPPPPPVWVEDSRVIVAEGAMTRTSLLTERKE